MFVNEAIMLRAIAK